MNGGVFHLCMSVFMLLHTVITNFISPVSFVMLIWYAFNLLDDWTNLEERKQCQVSDKSKHLHKTYRVWFHNEINSIFSIVEDVFNVNDGTGENTLDARNPWCCVNVVTINLYLYYVRKLNFAFCLPNGEADASLLMLLVVCTVSYAFKTLFTLPSRFSVSAKNNKFIDFFSLVNEFIVIDVTSPGTMETFFK